VPIAADADEDRMLGVAWSVSPGVGGPPQAGLRPANYGQMGYRRDNGLEVAERPS
jgi:hypothetical protein